MKNIEVSAAIIISDNRIFATQRGAGKNGNHREFKDFWEFPGGKIEAGETPEEAVRREIREELETDIEVGDFLCTVTHDYPEFHLTMHCFICRVVSGALTLTEHESARWLCRDELWTVEWLPADVKVVEALLRYLGE